MKVGAKDYQYAVVQFLKRPRPDIDDFVCIPHSWIRIRRVTEEQSIVAYPNERPSVTQRRIEDGENPSGKWTLYIAVVKLETQTYEEAKNYALEKKYGVAEEDLYSSLRNVANSPIKRPQPSEFQLDAVVSKLRVIEMNNGSSLLPDTWNTLPTKNQIYKYPYLQKIPDYHDSGNECDIVKKSFIIPKELRDSMKQRLLKPQLSSGNNIQFLKISEANDLQALLVPEYQSESLPDERIQDSDVQMINEVETVQIPANVSQDDSDSLSEKCTKDDQPDDYPMNKIRTTANFISNLFNIMETSYVNASERILEMHKLFDQSTKLLECIKKEYECKKSKQNNEKAEEETPEVINEVKTSENGDDDSNEDELLKKPQSKMRNFILPPDYDPRDTRWTLKYRENNPELSLVELVPGSKVYVNPIKLAHCKRVSKDCKALARRLLVEIFSHSALTVCSLTGAKANAFHNNGTYIRPGLDAEARTTMFSYVEDYAREKQWPTYDKQSVVNSVRSKIQEIRSKHAKI